jgi:hypothetical protein
MRELDTGRPFDAGALQYAPVRAFDLAMRRGRKIAKVAPPAAVQGVARLFK